VTSIRSSWKFWGKLRCTPMSDDPEDLFASVNGGEGPMQKHCGAFFFYGPFSRELHLFCGDFDEVGDSLSKEKAP
jgi:hypothetical protein